MIRTLIIAVILAGMVGPAFAEDLIPPPWRGEPRTTFAIWEFDTPDLNPMPNFWDNPFGPPNLIVEPIGDWDDIVGAWPLSGMITVEIMNFPEPLEWKDIWIQLTWKPEDGAMTPFPVIEVTDSFGMISPIYDIVEEIQLNEGWLHTTYQTQIFPNPQFEVIMITGEIWVDELVIDTRCIPEPATIGLLSVGALALLRRKRN